MYEITLKTTPETKQFIKDNPEAYHRALVKGFRKGLYYIEGKVKKSFGTAGKPKVRRGHLRRNIYSRMVDRGPSITGIIGSDLIYAGVQEEGRVIKQRKSKFLRFKIDDRWVTVAQVTIPDRPYIEPAIKESQDKLADIILKEIKTEMEGL